MVRSIGATLFATALFGTSGVAALANVHQVVPGETLAAVAQREHVSIEELTRINQLEGTSDRRLLPGTLLALDEPGSTQIPAPQFYIAGEQKKELREAEIASNPSAAADAAMWSNDTSAIGRFASRIMNRTSTIALVLTRSAMRFIGTPYVFGGTSPSGFDCSGYTQHVFAMAGLHLPRTADLQFYAGQHIANGLKAGDLVFFQTYEPGPSHVGIYIGNGNFIHSSSHGVMISRLADSYWASRYLGAKRYPKVNPAN